MATARPDIVYVHHGAARIYDTVVAIGRAGYSCRYLAGYYFDENGLPERLLRRLGAQRALARLKRRHNPRLPAGQVERSFLLELMMTLEIRFPRLLPNFVLVRNLYIDLRGALRVMMLRPRAVIVCDTHALYTLRMAKRIGAVAILDQMIGHLSAGNRVLAEERRLHPEIPTDFRPAPARQVRRCGREVREAEYILAPSDYVRTSVIEAGAAAERVFLLPYGADTDMFGREAEPPTPPFRILFAGHIGLRKGVIYLLEAVRRLNLPDIELVLLGRIEGNGDWLAPWRDIFVHRAHLPHPQIPAVFAAAHVYVYPSLHEGSTVSIYEAMASGLPVVTTPNAGSVVRDGTDGYVVPIRDVDALAQRIETLYRDGDLRRKMGASARRQALEHTWDAYARRLSSLLGKLLD